MEQKTFYQVLILCLVFFASLIVLFARLGDPHLSDWDEAWHGAISRTMSRDGEVFTPKWNGRPYLEKPPLYYWLSSTVYRIIGDTSLSARVISAAAGVATVVVVYVIASRMRGTLTGVIASSILLSTIGFVSRARTGNLDSLFALCFISSIASYDLMRRSRSHAWTWVLGLCLLSGFLTKGFGIFLVPAICIAYHLAKKDVPTVRKLAWSIFIAVAGITTWFGLSYIVNGQAFINEFLFHQSDKLVGKTSVFEHVSLTYFTHLKSGLKLWLFAAIPAIGYGLYRLSGQKHEHSTIHILALFIIVFLALLSFVESKNNWFLMPLYPYIAVLTAVFIYDNAKRVGYIRTVVFLCLMVGIVQTYYYRDSIFVPDVVEDRSEMATLAKSLTSPDEPLYITNSYYPAAVYYSERTVYAVYSEHAANESWWILPVASWPDIISPHPVYIMTNTNELDVLKKSVPDVVFEQEGRSGDIILMKTYETP